MTKFRYISNRSNKFLASFPGIDLKENLNINIPTKERIANVDIFLCFIQNFRKYMKIVLTIVVE